VFTRNAHKGNSEHLAAACLGVHACIPGLPGELDKAVTRLVGDKDAEIAPASFLLDAPQGFCHGIDALLR